MQAGSTGFSESYNPLQLTAAPVSWTDLNRDVSRRASSGASTGSGVRDQPGAAAERFRRRQSRELDPAMKRIQHRERRQRPARAVHGVSVSGGWFHRDFKNLRRRVNVRSR
jgi:hypothetical protein